MARIDSFTFKVNATERDMIERLAKRLQRTQSDAVRLAIREALRALDTDQPVIPLQPMSKRIERGVEV